MGFREKNLLYLIIFKKNRTVVLFNVNQVVECMHILLVMLKCNHYLKHKSDNSIYFKHYR